MLKITGESLQKSAYFPNYTNALALAAGVAEYATVPDGASVVLITATQGIWGDRGTTAAIPAADVTNGTAAFYISGPAWFRVSEGDNLAFVSAADCVVSLSFYS